jgi:hypothetical protein
MGTVMASSDRAPPAGQKQGMAVTDWSALMGDASRLSDAKLLQIYRLLDQVGDKPEVSSVFASLRPRLAELRPPRRQTPPRLLFRPIEDLLDNQETYSRRLGRISRATLTPCWRAVKDYIPQAVQRDVQQAVARIDPYDGEVLAGLCETFWQMGADALSRVLAECDANLKHKVALFGRDEDVIRQLEAIREIIAIAPLVERMKASLPPRPITSLSESHLDSLRKELLELGREDVRQAIPLVRVISSRMQRPGDLLRLLGDLRLGGAVQDKEAMNREMSGYVVGDLLRQSNGLAPEGVVQRPAALDNMAVTAERLADGLNSINDMVQSLRDKELSAKMQTARADVAQYVLKNICGAIDQADIDAVFPATGTPSVETLKKAEHVVMALRRSSRIAGPLGIQKEVSNRITDIRRRLEQQTNAALRKIPRNRDGTLTPDGARHMFNSLRLLEILAGSEEAERLYREWNRQYW